MKNINLIIETIASWAKKYDFSRDDISYLSIEKFERLATDSPSAVLKQELDREINYSKKRHSFTTNLRLPSLIRDVLEIENFELAYLRPNFVTNEIVSGFVHVLDQPTSNHDLGGKIVLIQAADPGYDWIFTKNIAGLITQFGGSASHMAIRAAEFGLPAAIGCGEKIFNEVKTSEYVELNCVLEKITPKIVDVDLGQ